LAYFLSTNIIGNSAQTAHVRLGVSKRVLASQLSIAPETLSRLFARFQSEGIIDIQDGTIMLLDEQRLRDYIQLAP
jgi:DNA-binding transcriptional regulator YhcF (GntR family)